MSEIRLKNSLHNLDFGSKSEEGINSEIEENASNNTKKTRGSIWKQFSRLHSFVKNYRWDHVVLPTQIPRVGIFGPIF
jgi:hypothetical protein